MSDTLTDLMSKIPGDDDAVDNTSDTSTEQATDTGTSTGGEADAQAGAASTDAASRATADAAAGTTQQAAGAATQAAPAGRVTKLGNGLEIRPDPANPKNSILVDPRTGATVAANAMEVRNYKAIQKENQTYQQEVTTLRAQVQAYEQATTYAREQGLTPEHQLTAVRIMGDFLKDPGGTLGKLVAEMQAAGHELPFMQQAGISPKVLEQIIDKRLAPLTAQQQQHTEQAAIDTAAQEQLDNFLMAHQDATNNIPFLGYILEKGGATTYEGAYITMLKWCAQNKLDHTQPLEPQIEARRAAAAKPTGATSEPVTAGPRTPLPNGRNALDVGAQSTAEAAQRDGLYSEHMSWEDIVRHGMREAGYIQ